MGGTVLDFKSRDALRAAKVREKRIYETGVADGREEGLERGREDGREEGREEGYTNHERETVFRMLANKFKTDDIRRVLGLARNVVDDYKYEYDTNKRAIHKQYNIDTGYSR